MYKGPNLFTQSSQNNLGMPRISNENRSTNLQYGGGKLSSQFSSIGQDGRRRTSRMRGVSLFKDNSIDNYFSELRQMLKTKSIRTKIQA